VPGIEVTEVEAPDKVVPPVLMRVKPPPLAGAAHFKPVGETELSATMLQLGKGIILGSAQSCAIVVDTIG
jgi:hypothetical protein